MIHYVYFPSCNYVKCYPFLLESNLFKEAKGTSNKYQGERKTKQTKKKKGFFTNHHFSFHFCVLGQKQGLS